MFPASLLLVALQVGDPLDRVTTTRGPQTVDLEWSDAEDRLQGTVRPLEPLADKPVAFSLRVGAYQGAELDTPLTVTLRCGTWSQSQTLSRAKDAKAWYFEMTSPQDGDCNVDVGWQSTRHKVVHFPLTLGPAPLPRWPWYALMGTLAAVALGFGIRAALKKPEA